ncbi:unnamed protein product [Merluccius merluccius]
MHRPESASFVATLYRDKRVLAWTGQPLSLFQDGDWVLALNDLLTCSLANFYAYLSSSFKNQVKGCRALHLWDVRFYGKGDCQAGEAAGAGRLGWGPGANRERRMDSSVQLASDLRHIGRQAPEIFHDVPENLVIFISVSIVARLLCHY